MKYPLLFLAFTNESAFYLFSMENYLYRKEGGGSQKTILSLINHVTFSLRRVGRATRSKTA